ncbi:CopD family protein [Marinobacterium sediminicola]|uniref:Protoporphyrinogen IX oxidase n=1 Tax=Marinobacterium sediminicola TaxID=518898 RepID=A0ABY1S1V1_9GAMM|nr:CopD family protein [Marinobacterium sediminicola]ULG69510.1 CopD family protein [Marinobacterium sediminicola]SMR75661.1 putative membrane protein [Marinobacterium sediminicola]
MLWFKMLHILAMTSWMAGIFYLPRIFVHYVEGREAGQDVSRLEIMARKLFGFMTIMAVFTLGLGFWLWLGYGFSGGWLHAKLLFVVLLIGYHFWCRAYLKQMQRGELSRSGRYFRLYNELPLLIFIPILIFVVVKPF